MGTLSKKRLKKLKERKQSLKDAGASGLIFIKANETKRLRPLPVNEDEEPGREVITMFLGDAYKGTFISPKSIGLPCALYEKYEELKESKDEDDEGLMEKLKPKNRFVVPCVVKKDKAGKEVDEAVGAKLAMLVKGAYQQMIDLFLDEDHGDFTDPKEGYDIKITRTGSTMTDTEYSVLPGKASILPKKYNKIYDTEEMLTKIIPSYEETQRILGKLLGSDDDEDGGGKKKKKKPASMEEKRKLLKKKKKVKKTSDDE
jgi:hypothetical protein